MGHQHSSGRGLEDNMENIIDKSELRECRLTWTRGWQLTDTWVASSVLLLGLGREVTIEPPPSQEATYWKQYYY